MPLLLEQACRYRVVGMEEMASYRVSWSKVLALISNNPEIMPQRSDFENVRQAVPEIFKTQPSGVYREVVLIKEYCIKLLAVNLEEPYQRLQMPS